MKKEQLILWTDLHSNLHHENIHDLPKWLDHAKQLLDFWPIAYYPYYMRTLPSNMGVEDLHDLDKVKADWEYLRAFVKDVNEAGYPMFMGYEWQGSGKDGDHNVFFKDNDEDIAFPLRYQELYETYKEKNAIAIPHHLAYQINNRGKNWDTHIEAFSPFAELYSSHGSSENDDGPIAMTRHVHMGPRVGQGCVEEGLCRGYRLGLIASGDNHAVPAMSMFGTMALISEGRTKEEIWKAMKARHVYGVSEERIDLDVRVDEAIMGDEVLFHDNNQVALHIHAANAIDFIEVLADNQRVMLIDGTRPHDIPAEGSVRFQWKLEFGWGPDRRVFPEIASKKWHVDLQTQGMIHRVLPCWNSFGQKQIKQDPQECEWELTTYKTTQSGKWMGVSSVTTESMIVEMTCDVNECITLVVDGTTYQIPVRQILTDSTLVSLDQEVQDLIQTTYGETSFYRNDTWWHNSYKFKLHKGALLEEYHQEYDFVMNLCDVQQLRFRIHQKNGCLAWTSPFFRKEEA